MVNSRPVSWYGGLAEEDYLTSLLHRRAIGPWSPDADEGVCTVCGRVFLFLPNSAVLRAHLPPGGDSQGPLCPGGATYEK